MATTSLKRAQTAIDRAIVSSRAAKAAAMLVGDSEARAEQAERVARLVDRQQELAREVAAGIDVAARTYKQRKASEQVWKHKDTLAAMAGAEPPEISRAQFRAALILRDHVEAASGGSPSFRERVDGGALQNDQMESQTDRRRRLEYSLSAAIDAIEDQRIWAGTLSVIIYGKSFRSACRLSGISEGKGIERIKVAIDQALDAAVAHLGIGD